MNFEKRLKEVYEAIFLEKYLSTNIIHLGKMEFDKNSKVELLKLINPISTYYKGREL